MTSEQGSPAAMKPPHHAMSTFGDAALEPMHKHMIDYGLCWLRGGGLDSESMHSEIIQTEPGEIVRRLGVCDDPKKLRIIPSGYSESDEQEPRYWTQPEIEMFGRLHSRIIRLPLVAHSLALQVFYGEGIAAEWRWVPPDKKAKVLRDLVFWSSPPYGLNARLKRAGDSRLVRDANEFIPLLVRALRILLNGERTLGSLRKSDTANKLSTEEVLRRPKG